MQETLTPPLSRPDPVRQSRRRRGACCQYFGGPGSGKSTLAAELFFELKKNTISRPPARGARQTGNLVRATLAT